MFFTMDEPKIIIKNLPDEINGLYLSNGKRAAIYINSNLNNAQKVCAIAHELIHHYYYPDCNFYKCTNYFEICNCNWIENKTAKKVTEWLISDIVFERLVLPYLDIYPLSVLAEEINVTEEILKLRLEIYKERIKE